MNYALILAKHFVGKKWNANGESYEGIDWLDETLKPTKQELELLWEKTKAIVNNEVMEQKRKIAYQFECDPLFFKWQRGEVTKEDWLNAVNLVKTRYPKI